MSWLRDLLGVYERVLRRAVELTVRNWWLGLVVLGYVAALLGVGLFAGGLGIVGGFVVTLSMAALASSWLVLLGHVVREGRTTVADLPGSFGVYFGDVLTFGFLLWGLQFIASVALAQSSYLTIVFGMALLVFLSAVPEQIYLAGEGSTAVFVESYRFVAKFWIEWLPAIAVFAAPGVLATLVPFLPVSLVLLGLTTGFWWIARGLLFLELTTSSRRAREFQRRATG